MTAHFLIDAVRPVAPYRQNMGDRGRKFLQAIAVRDRLWIVRLRSADASLRSLCHGIFLLIQFGLFVHSGKTWGTVVENFFRPSECVTDGGSFDSVRLTPHSAHDDSAFFDRRRSIWLGGRSTYAIRLAVPLLRREWILAGFCLRAFGGGFGRVGSLARSRVG